MMKRIGLLGLSNPCTKERVNKVVAFLEQLAVDIVVSDRISHHSSGKQRAEIFNQMMKENLDYVFDLSGGDVANEVLPYIDYELYAQSKTIFHGYSDVTCVLNALASYRPCVLFQLAGNTNTDLIRQYILEEDHSLICSHALGGNIRCLLKLAGTKYWPQLDGQVLLLESYSGSMEKIRAYFAQLDQLQVFEKVQSLILAQFTELDQNERRMELLELAQSYGLLIDQLPQVGHSSNALAVKICRK